MVDWKQKLKNRWVQIKKKVAYNLKNLAISCNWSPSPFNTTVVPLCIKKESYYAQRVRGGASSREFLNLKEYKNIMNMKMWILGIGGVA